VESLFLGKEAVRRLRAEIAKANGNEVCFLASVKDGGEIAEPRVVARGHRAAVLAAVRDGKPGQLVLHNHPSGPIEPSNADLDVAAQLYDNGLGFGIIDNDAHELYVVLEPALPKVVLPLDPEEIAATLAPGGPVSEAHAAYEDRATQRDLARAVTRAYNEGGVAVLEAGTGTGKSVAYLIPAIFWALKNRSAPSSPPTPSTCRSSWSARICRFCSAHWVRTFASHW
jgi:ATP-dependent DNA helicase DinG